MYNKQVWINNSTPVDAEHLNHMEDGILNGVEIHPNGVDDTAEIQAAINANNSVKLASGNFKISATITLPDHASISGHGASTVITTLSDIDAISVGKWCTIRDVQLIGTSPDAMPSAAGNGSGIHATEDSHTLIVARCVIRGFKHSGIFMDATGQDVRDGASITDCDLYYNYIALRFINSEYIRTTGCNIHRNVMGVQNRGGNNSFINCGINSNHTGFSIDPKSGDTNQAHGQCVGCTFNHNANFAMTLNNIPHGYIFANCQFWYGKISTYGNDGLLFTGCEFGNDLTVEFTGTNKKPILIGNLIKDGALPANCVGSGNYSFAGAAI